MDRVQETVGSFFAAVFQIRHSDTQSKPLAEVIHRRLLAFLQRSMRRASELGFNQQDTQDIGYLLAAFADEVIVSCGGELQQFWVPRMLQLQLFNENVAGEKVFEKIESLLSDPTRTDVLRVYYLGLLLGFRGKYRIQGGEIELNALVDRMDGALGNAGSLAERELSPDKSPPRDHLPQVVQGGPWLWSAAGALAFSALLFLGLSISISVTARHTTEHTNQVATTILR